MKYKFRKASAAYETTVNMDEKEERYKEVMRTMNTFFAAMRVNGKQLTPKNYKLTIETLKEFTNNKAIIEYIKPVRKHEKRYTEGKFLLKAYMKVEFSEDIKTLGNKEEVFKKVKEILRGKK